MGRSITANEAVTLCLKLRSGAVDDGGHNKDGEDSRVQRVGGIR